MQVAKPYMTLSLKTLPKTQYNVFCVGLCIHKGMEMSIFFKVLGHAYQAHK